MKYFSLLIIALILLSCTDDNNVSTTPSISFETLEFKKSDNNFSQDYFSQLISKKSEIQVINIKNRDELKNFLKKNLFDDEMVICMGAGSISNWIREIGTELQ